MTIRFKLKITCCIILPDNTAYVTVNNFRVHYKDSSKKYTKFAKQSI